ncbi:MAG TPA: AfsR family transcriptional regulator, partial [Pseudonocardiaceae bacterium]
AARPHWTLARLAGRLAGTAAPLDELRLGGLDLRASIERSYRGLGEQGRTALRRLALLDVPDFPGWAAAAMLGVPRTAGEEIAEELVDARLLQVSLRGPGQRHSFHALVRMFALERADRADRLVGAWHRTPPSTRPPVTSPSAASPPVT